MSLFFIGIVVQAICCDAWWFTAGKYRSAVFCFLQRSIEILPIYSKLLFFVCSVTYLIFCQIYYTLYKEAKLAARLIVMVNVCGLFLWQRNGGRIMNKSTIRCCFSRSEKKREWIHEVWWFVMVVEFDFLFYNK